MRYMNIFYVSYILLFSIIMFCILTQCKGVKKLHAISCYFIIITFVRISMNPNDVASNRVCGLISLFLFLLYSFWFLKKAKSLCDIVFLSAGVVMLAVYAVVISITFSYFTFWAFKLLFMFILVCIVFKYAAFGKYISVSSVIIAYIIMVILNAILSGNVLYSLIPDSINNFYSTVSAMYTLPDLEKVPSIEILISNLINFIICRIMDAVLLGSVVNFLFTENSKEIVKQEKKDVPI